MTKNFLKFGINQSYTNQLELFLRLHFYSVRFFLT